MISLEEAVVRKLKAAQQILCIVESCTGGLVSHSITNVSGASEVYWGTFVTYDNSAKEDLGVSVATLAQRGAVSAEVAKEMAEGGLRKMKESSRREHSFSLLKPRGLVSLAITGIAGPSGGSREKPVGLCFIALAFSEQPTIVEQFDATVEGRLAIKEQFAQKALEMIRSTLKF